MRIVNNLSEKLYPVNVSNQVHLLISCIQRVFQKTLTVVLKVYEKAGSLLPRWEKSYLTCKGKTFSDYTNEDLERKKVSLIAEKKPFYLFSNKETNFKGGLFSLNVRSSGFECLRNVILNQKTVKPKSCLKQPELKPKKVKKVHFKDLEPLKDAFK